MEWIDCELADNYQLNYSSSHSVDLLLELRALVISERTLNQFVKGFYKLLPRLEKDFYLLGYRIRQWLSIHLEVMISDPLERVDRTVYQIHQTTKSLDRMVKNFFEAKEYEVLYQDIRVEIVKK